MFYCRKSFLLLIFLFLAVLYFAQRQNTNLSRYAYGYDCAVGLENYQFQSFPVEHLRTHIPPPGPQDGVLVKKWGGRLTIVFPRAPNPLAAALVSNDNFAVESWYFLFLLKLPKMYI